MLKRTVNQAKRYGEAFVPDPLVLRVYPPLVAAYAHTMTWYACGRRYRAEIDPLGTIEIDPSLVSEKVPLKDGSWFDYSNAVCEVIGGDWDRNTHALSEYSLYVALKRRFIDGEPWSETEFYDRVADEIDRGIIKWGCTSIDEFETRLAELEKLYETIRDDGYQTQRELRSSHGSFPAQRTIHSYWPPELHEVTINVGRDGRLILHDGRHRLTIARLLELDEIPVRVKVRHEEWQEIRERAVRGEPIPDAVRSHPDLPDTRS